MSYISPGTDPDEWADLADRLEALLDGPDPDPTVSRYDPADVYDIDNQRVRPNSRGERIPSWESPTPCRRHCWSASTTTACSLTSSTTRRHEGLYGYVQGGFIAAAFDLLLGHAVARLGGRGVTASLSVGYRVPTPIGEPLQYRGEFLRIEGRKAYSKAQLVRLADGVVTAEADGLFVTPAPAASRRQLTTDRNAMVMKLASPGIDLGIVVSDLDRSLQFYRGLLGLHHEGSNPVPGGGTMHRLWAAESMIKLVAPESPPEQPVIAGGLRGGALGLRTSRFAVVDLDELMAHLAANDVPVITRRHRDECWSSDRHRRGSGRQSRRVPGAPLIRQLNDAPSIAAAPPAPISRGRGSRDGCARQHHRAKAALFGSP